ncbi:MAG: heparinase II/III family protein [Nibricoccus sp.]
MKNHPINPNRRTFLKSSALIASALTVSSARLGGSTATPASAPVAPPSRGLLFDPSEAPRILANLDHPRCADLKKELLGADLAGDREFIKNQVRLDNHVYDQSRVRRILERTSFVYALTGDADQLAVATMALEKLLQFPKWDYFLEAGRQVLAIQRASETVIAIVLALDWLGDALAPELKAEAEKQIAEKGAPACFTMLYGCKYPDRVRGWTVDPEEKFPIPLDLKRWPLILNATNLKTIPLAGLGFAACWLRGRHPQAESWLNLARDSARAFSVMFGADGTYEEGVGYWGYAAIHLVLFGEVLWRSQRIDDRSLFNYTGMANFALSMTMPTAGETVPSPAGQNMAIIEPRQDLVNFSDSGTAMDVSIMPWIARTHDSAIAQHVALNIGGLRSQYAAIWLEPSRPATPPPVRLLDVRLSNDWVVSRTGWSRDDAVVAMRSGGPSNHEHADRNSVIFKAYGERLFHDPFRAGYDQNLPRWRLRQTSAHTAVLIDGRGHQYHDGSEGTNSSWSWARVLDFQTGRGWMTVTSDATEAYALVDESVAWVGRTLVYLKPDVLLIADHVRLTGRPRPVQLRFQVYNDDRGGRASAQGKTFRIERPNAELGAEIFSSESIGLSEGRLELPEQIGVYPFIEATSAAALEHRVLTVATASPRGGGSGALKVTTASPGEWRVTGEHRGQKVDVAISLTGGALPKITIVA